MEGSFETRRNMKSRDTFSGRMEHGAIISTGGDFVGESEDKISQLFERKDVPFLNIDDLIVAVDIARDKLGIIKPAIHLEQKKGEDAKAYKKRLIEEKAAVKAFWIELVKKVHVQYESGRIRYFINAGTQREDITSEINDKKKKQAPQERAEYLKGFYNEADLFGVVNFQLKSILEQADLAKAVVVVRNPTMYTSLGKPIFALKNNQFTQMDHGKYAVEPVIDVDKRPSVFAVRDRYRSLKYEREVDRLRTEISRDIEEGKINIVDALDLQNKERWPRDNFMMDVRAKINPIIEDFLKDKPKIDRQDLEHQVLFFLTTYSPSELFEDGDKIVSYFKSLGVYDDWKNIFKIDSEFLSNFKINTSLVRKSLEQQYLIISNRLEKNHINLEEILSLKIKTNDTEIPFFADSVDNRWELQKVGDKIFASININGEAVKIPVRFGEIDGETAASITENLHYIHTLRINGAALGLSLELPVSEYKDYNNPFAFIDGDQLIVPFAVETVEFSEDARDYKKAAALMHGIHPKRFAELTRMYTFPNGPKNIIGLMDGLVPSYILQSLRPNTQAIATAFMPTYAKTRSTTIAGEIKNCLMAKGLRHTFVKSVIDGQTVYEHVTRRRENDRSETVSTNPEFPLLPVIEAYMTTKNQSSFPALISKPDKSNPGQMLYYKRGEFPTYDI